MIVIEGDGGFFCLFFFQNSCIRKMPLFDDYWFLIPDSDVFCFLFDLKMVIHRHQNIMLWLVILFLKKEENSVYFIEFFLQSSLLLLTKNNNKGKNGNWRRKDEKSFCFFFWQLIWICLVTVCCYTWMFFCCFPKIFFDTLFCWWNMKFV